MERALTLQALAETLQRGGRASDRERARELFREAISEFESMGAEAHVERSRAQLRELEAEAG
jgi:hypothetical protein